MQKSVSFRFYKITRGKTVPEFADALDKISKIVKKGDRERQIAPDFVLRLEELEDDGPGAIVGEIIRVQKTNMPSEVHTTGRTALTTKNNLGHGIIFRYNKAKGILCAQYDPRIASPGRLIDYIQECWPEAVYDILPVLKTKAWERFNKGNVRKLSIRVAQPEHLSDAGKGSNSAVGGLKAMAAAFEAPSIRVDISVGHHRRALKDGIKNFAEGILERSKGGSSIESMKAVAYVDDARDEIDLIEERLKAKDTLGLDDRDPEKNYKIKRAAIKTMMKDQGY